MNGRPDSFFPFYMGDYLQDTLHLTTRQHGAYLLLLTYCYAKGAPLPLEDEAIRIIVREKPREWAADRPAVMAYFERRDDGWHQKRVGEVLTQMNERYARRKAVSVTANAAKTRRRARPRAGHHEGDLNGDLKGDLRGTQREREPQGKDPYEGPSRSGLAAARVEAAPPPNALRGADGWESAHRGWAAFRAKIGEGEWGAWFADARLGADERTLLTVSAFSRDQIRFRYAAALAEHFGGLVSIEHAPTEAG